MSRAWRLIRGLFTWEACGTFVVYAVVALLVALVVDQRQGREAAQTSLDTARTLATHRITLLTNKIDHLSRQLAHASHQRGVLLAKIEALTEQLRQLGVQPVTTVPGAAPGPQPSGSPQPTSTVRVVRTKSPRSQPTATVTRTAHPTPSPSKSCHVTVLGVCL